MAEQYQFHAPEELKALLKDHQLSGVTCSCGWHAQLGTSIRRGFDQHLLDMRAARRS